MGSKTVKAVAGVALAIFAPTVANIVGTTLFGASMSAGIYTALTVGATLVGASLAGSALAPDIPDLGDISGADQYAGQKLTATRNNTGTVPIVYGFHRLAGNVIYQEANNEYTGDDTAKGYNRDYWSIITFAGHIINDVTDIFADQQVLTNISGNIYTNTYHHIKWYNASTTATNIQDVDFVVNDDGDTDSGLNLALADAEIPANVAFMAVHQLFDGQQNKNTQLATMTVELEGKKIRTFIDADTISTTTSYSSNPAEIILDILSEGLAVPDSKIDTASFYAVKTACATYGWDCNLALIQQANVQSIIQEVLSTFRGQIIHSENTWKLKVDAKNQTSVATLTDDDIVNNTLNMTMRGSKDIFNKVRFKYINPSDEWLASQALIEDTDLQDLEGQIIEKILDVKAVTNTTQAEELAEITLNASRYTEDALGNRIKQTPLICNFATSVKHADLEVGDIITIDHDLLDRNRKFMILSLETDQSGLIQVSAREYAETHYKDSSGTYII